MSSMLDFGLDKMTSAEDVADVVVKNISLDLIDENPDNEKIFDVEKVKALSEDIKKNGFFGAIDLLKKEGGRYQIISGHRRVRAMRMLGEKAIRAILCEDLSDAQIKHRLISSNLLARATTPMERARAYRYEYQNFTDGDDEAGKIDVLDKLSAMYDVSKGNLSKMIKLTYLIPELQALVDQEVVPWSAIYAVANYDASVQKKILEGIEAFISDMPEDEKSVSAADLKRIVYEKTRGRKDNNGGTSVKKANKISASYTKAKRVFDYMIKIPDDKLKGSPEDMEAFERSVTSMREALEALEQKLASLKN